jgi:hypothetical protein
LISNHLESVAQLLLVAAGHFFGRRLILVSSALSSASSCWSA